MEEAGTSPLKQGVKLRSLIERPQLAILSIAPFVEPLAVLVDSLPEDRRLEIVEAAEILIKYEGYIARERLVAEKLRRLEDVKLSADTDYSQIRSLSTEARQKLDRHKPSSVGEASRIPGVSPSDVSILLLLMNR